MGSGVVVCMYEREGMKGRGHQQDIIRCHTSQEGVPLDGRGGKGVGENYDATARLKEMFSVGTRHV